MLQLQTPKNDSLSFVGTLNQKTLALERRDGEQVHRLVFSLLHANRFLYRYETRAVNKSLVTKQWTVGATKEGEPFAAGDGRPECIVTGGAGTMAVTYQGKTYYVCCSGCRQEFLDNPMKYINEAAAKKSKSK
ncbi:MAG: YHS domain-containing protein [Gemmataceae bacterium]|nr:YHS domain-containing protein [Gemmataceae bacterium]